MSFAADLSYLGPCFELSRKTLTYPRWRQVVPEGGSGTLVVSGTALHSAVASLVPKGDAVVRLDYVDGTLMLTTETARAEVPAVSSGVVPVIGFNGRYLRELAVAVAAALEAVLSFEGDLDPMAARAEGVTLVCMPMRV